MIFKVMGYYFESVELGGRLKLAHYEGLHTVVKGEADALKDRVPQMQN
jgi:hypothetical protein